MPTCVNCISITPTNCIRSEEELSFEYNDFNDLLKKLDEKSSELKMHLLERIDKKWVTEEHVYITEYIQDIINKIDVILSQPKEVLPTFNITSSITGSGEKTLFQILTILVKEVEALKNSNKNSTSQLYIANV